MRFLTLLTAALLGGTLTLPNSPKASHADEPN